jgi:hypothetical protein
VTAKTIKVAVFGCGDFGSQLIFWLQQSMRARIEILYFVEPNLSRANVRKVLRKHSLQSYSTVAEVPEQLLRQTDVIIDCTTQGAGPANLALYKSLSIPAVFQNGESPELCQLFYSLLATPKLRDPYLKIAKCSALSTLNVMTCLQAIGVEIKKASVHHCKVNNSDRMLSMDYESGQEVTMLNGVPTRADVVYLRGNAPAGYVYHGYIHMQLADNTLCTQEQALAAFSESEQLLVVSENLDSRTCQRTDKTLVIREGLVLEGNRMTMSVLSFTPEVNFPQIFAALQILTGFKN